MVGPLTVSLVLVWVWPHSLAVTCIIDNACIVIATLAAVLEPKIGSHITGIESPFGYKALVTLDTERQLFFSLPYFGFRTSVSVLRFPHFSVFHLPQLFFYGRNVLQQLIKSLDSYIITLSGPGIFAQDTSSEIHHHH